MSPVLTQGDVAGVMGYQCYGETSGNLIFETLKFSFQKYALAASSTYLKSILQGLPKVVSLSVMDLGFSTQMRIQIILVLNRWISL